MNHIALVKKFNSFFVKSVISFLSGLYTLNPNIGDPISLTITSPILKIPITNNDNHHLYQLLIFIETKIKSSLGPNLKYFD